MKKIVLLLLISLSPGCANLFSIHRDLDVNQGMGALIDIKQRAIFVSKQNQGNGEKVLICAEPSPDAMSAYASELAGSFSISAKAEAELASATQEQAAFVGLRTQSIQLLRDSLYRMCEAYMSGAISKYGYGILMRRYQRHMVALLAIEQLTGAIRSPAIVINTEGSANAAQSILSLRNQLTIIEQKIVELDDKINKKEAEKKVDGVTDEQKKKIDTAIAGYKSQKTVLESDKKAVASAIENAKGNSVSGGGTATINLIGAENKPNISNNPKVSEVVGNIVNKILDTDDTGQLCWAYLQENKNNSSKANDDFYSICKDFVSNINKKNLAVIKLINSSASLPPNKRSRILEKLNNGEFTIKSF